MSLSESLSHSPSDLRAGRRTPTPGARCSDILGHLDWASGAGTAVGGALDHRHIAPARSLVGHSRQTSFCADPHHPAARQRRTWTIRPEQRLNVYATEPASPSHDALNLLA